MTRVTIDMRGFVNMGRFSRKKNSVHLKKNTYTDISSVMSEGMEGHRMGGSCKLYEQCVRSSRSWRGGGRRLWVEAQGWWYLGERWRQCLFNQASPPTGIRQLPTASPPLPLYSGYRRLCKPAGQVRQAVLARGDQRTKGVLINDT